MSRPTIQNGQEPLVLKKTVVFRPTVTTDTLKGGQLVSYNYDSVLDWEKNSKTVNSFSRTAVAFAEGSQDFNARFLEVEKPASGNLNHFAGVVALTDDGATDGDIIEILIPVEGAVVPVYTDLSVTNGSTILAVKSASYKATNPVYGGSTTPSRVIGIALETKDRSTVNGLTWMRFHSGLRLGEGVSANNYQVGASAATGTMLPCSISVESIQTGGEFHSIRIRGELAGAGSFSSGLVRLEGVVNANIVAVSGVAAVGISNHLIFKTGCTPGAGRYAGSWIKIENQDATPADLAAADICTLWLSMQNNDAPSTSCQIYLDSDGTDDPDYFLISKSDAAVVATAFTGDITFDTNDVGLKVKIGATTRYIVTTDGYV